MPRRREQTVARCLGVACRPVHAATVIRRVRLLCVAEGSRACAGRLKAQDPRAQGLRDQAQATV
eukprot:10325849-Lingulodinium_polyedra.AAC.1